MYESDYGNGKSFINVIILIHPPLSVLFSTIGIRAGPSEKLDRLKVDRSS